MAKQRLDLLLVQRQLCESRQKAQGLIRAGEVKVNQQLVDKPGTLIDPTAEIEIRDRLPYVSRGGLKLAKALQEFDIQVSGRICLDGGISTGGFTDCLLQQGAQIVYGVDVGYGQVAWQLRQDPRVRLKERTNLRHLRPEDLYQDQPFADLGVLDLSFISLTKILEPLWHLLQPPRDVIMLIKPQFEVGRSQVGKGGIVRDPQAHAQAILTVGQQAESYGWQAHQIAWSPITGAAGNIEYLLWLSDHTHCRLDWTHIPNLTRVAQQILSSAAAT